MNKLDLTDGKETAINRAFSFFLYSPLTVGLAQNRRTIIKKKKYKRFDSRCGNTPHIRTTFQPAAGDLASGCVLEAEEKS